MNKTIINVPEYVNYISDWTDFSLPLGHSVINKTVCGCGFTQYCLENFDDVILCSPRVTLLENKEDQNSQCYYLRSIQLTAKQKEVLIKDIPEDQIDSVLEKYIYQKYSDSVFEYIQKRIQLSTNLRCIQPLKFLVTYDSLPVLIKILNYLLGEERLSKFYYVVDEFQLIFNDSHFKASTELNFISYLQDCPNVTYVSATPMLGEYLNELDEFKNLPYYEFNWGTRIIKPVVHRVNSSNLEQSALEIIKSYLDGNTESRINYKGDLIKSREVVFYCNNVGMITSIIKKAKLTPDQVNIIISKKSINKQKLYGIGKGFKFGQAPLRGKPHKMFTFCTSTAYCGMDFYSTNAKSIILSDCNLKTMALDISLDLPQIIGRQRLNENPFRFEAIFIYSTTVKEETKESLIRLVEKKKKNTEDLLNIFNSAKSSSERNILREDRKKLIKTYNYVDDYTGIDEKTGNLVLNKLVLLADLRAWEVQQLNYKDDISVLGTIKNCGIEEDNKINYSRELSYKIMSLRYFEERMEEVCKEYDKDPNTDVFNYIPSEYKNYINLLGTEQIRSCYFRKSLIDKLVGEGSKKENLNLLDSEIYKIFKEGEKYALSDIKEIFRNLLNQLSIISISPKASMIKKYFEVKRVKISTNSGRVEGFELLNKIK